MVFPEKNLLFPTEFYTLELSEHLDRLNNPIHRNSMKPTEKQIRDIAEYLEGGMRVFFNEKDGTVTYYTDEERWDGFEEELWEEAVEEVEANSDDLIEFLGFDSRESFTLMADFAESVDDEKLKQELFDALNRSRPFRNFKNLIDRSGPYREQWFAFRQKRYEASVVQQLETLEFLRAEESEEDLT